MPIKGTQDSAGYDMFSSEEKTIPPKSHTLVETHVSMEIPKNYFVYLCTLNLNNDA